MAQENCEVEFYEALSTNDISSLSNILAKNPLLITKRNPKRQHRTGLREALENNDTECVSVAIRAALTAISNSSFERKQNLVFDVAKDLCSIICDDRSSSSPFLNHESERKETVSLLENYHLLSDSDSFARVKHGIERIRRGGFVVVQDEFSRENEGDLIIAAEKMTTEKLAFMVNETSGVICVSIDRKRCEELELPQMVPNNTEKHRTAFTVSVDYKHGTSTGISAADRAATIRALADRTVKPDDFNRPGHIFPLRTRPGGVLERSGHTEASYDLAKLAGCYPAGAICEIANKDGSMMRTEDLLKFCRLHQLPLLTIVDLRKYLKSL
uniref:3,4-dihydroxy-2-butanone 4-phosphate synthase n=1 Tax=Hirondellea gigas TaxID=1518452 RepID=A0A6A7G9R6_9CRUS